RPAAAAAAVWFCYVIGRRARSPAAGAIAALMLACSPVFLYQSLLPMSDVPAAACWTAATAFLLPSPSQRRHRHLGETAAAGCCAALAILIRPNLAPLAAVFAPFAAARADAAGAWRHRVITFTVPIVVACAAIGGLNLHFYGSPLQSGYGDVRTAFAAAYVPSNIAHWAEWITASETPVVVLALVGVAAPLVGGAGPVSRRAGALVGAVAAAGGLSYASCSPFHEWACLRFPLSAFPPPRPAPATPPPWGAPRAPPRA